MATRKLYASLIGINAYENANNLNGCIKDILNFDRILRRQSSQPEEKLDYQPAYFLSLHSSDKKVLENYKESEKVQFDHKLPSFQNITGDAFNHLSKAGGNDICIVYFSGHGSYIDACPEFQRTNTTPQNETIVCLDSRSTARDIADKEIAFLLYKALKDKPGVHCLVVMDCCHSGSNTRDAGREGDPVIYRQEPSSRKVLAFQDYLGFSENFFEIRNGTAFYPIANYVTLGACRGNEKAQDGFSGGLFSRKLAELLTGNSTTHTYRQIAQSLSSTISIQNGHQNPVAYSYDDKNLDLKFLGGGFHPYMPGFEVRYITGEKIWRLQAGSLQGIVPSVDLRKTIVNIQPGNFNAEVTGVSDFTSTLEGGNLSNLDKNSNAYTATIRQLAIPKLVIGISRRLKQFPELISELEQSASRENHIYVELDSRGEKQADYLADVFESGNVFFYFLTQTQNDIPIFKSETDAGSFLKNADAVGKWIYVKNLKSKNTVFADSDFIFTAEVIEGVKVTRTNIDTIAGREIIIHPEETIDLSYKNDIKPALRFSLQIHPDSKLQECYVQALYLDSLFGITAEFAESDTSRLTRQGKFELKTKIDNSYFSLLVFKLDKEYSSYNINEVLEQLKIIVSTTPDIQLNVYRQESLTLDARDKNTRTRSLDNELFESEGESKWAIYNFGMRIIGPKKDKEITAGGETDFSSFSIMVPENFKARATAVTTADTALQNRSVSSGDAAVWGESLTEALPFADAFGSLAGSGVTALELWVKDGEALPVLPPGQEIIIKPKAHQAVTRSIEGFESTTVPYAFDEETQLYFPIGSQNETGNIVIDQLPKGTSGSLIQEAVSTRSISGSIKLYFKKLLRRSTSTLALHFFKNGEWKTTANPGEMKQFLHNQKLRKLPLVIHGILGDTKSIIEGLREDPDFGGRFNAILSYDFENLNTTVPQTSLALLAELKLLAIGENDIPKLTLIAHGMGGLVSRWLVEKAGGASLVEKLVMVGTPNGGSEWGEAGKQMLNGANFLLTHALNVTGPIKYAITGISFFIKKLHDPKVTMTEMGMEGEVIKELKTSVPPTNVKYYLIGSDTKLFREYTGNGFLAKVKTAIMENIVFPGFNLALFHQEPNDMAVTVKSMKSIEGFDGEQNMQVLPGDHISYFYEPATRKAILDVADF